MPNRRLLGAAFIVGSVILIGFSAKRGVTLTLVSAVLAAWVASRRLRHVSTRTIVGMGAGALVVLIGASVVSGIIVLPSSWPVVGRLAERASGSTTSSANNVTLRELMWGYALTTSWNQDPLVGVGAYHPIDVILNNNDIADHLSSGVHNSFIGYTFYAGYLEGLLVSGVYLWGLIRLWKVRRRSIYAQAMFGALVAVIVTALTNVSFEVTYMGGPSWLALGLAFGLSAKLMDMPDDAESDAGHDLDLVLAGGDDPSVRRADPTIGGPSFAT
jgi:O-antigen ligase